MRSSVATALFFLFFSGIMTACGSEPQPWDVTTGESKGEFLGPIPADFQNTATSEAFRLQAGAEAARLDAALAALGFTADGVALNGRNGVDPDLPDLDHCDQLREFSGGFLQLGDLASGDAQPDLLGLGDLTCRDIGAALDATFAGVAASTAAKARSLGNFSLARDRCTTAVEIPATTPRAAVGYEFLRVLGGEGLYLSTFDIGNFVSTFEGGADGGRLALRLEASMVAKADRAGDRRVRQDLTAATMIDTVGSVAESHKSETIELRRRFGDRTEVDTLGRQSVVTLAYGESPSIAEATMFTRLNADGSSDVWTVKARAQPVGEGRLSLDVEVLTADSARHVTFNCAGAAP